MSEVHKGRRGVNQRGGRAVRVKRWLPIVGVLGSYRRAWLMRDVVAAVTVCAVLVPQALAYGQLAGLSPVAGLYAALAPLVLYPLFASSRRLMVGPESGLAILTAVALAPLAAEGSAQFAVLAAMLALLTGAVLILAGVLRLGFLADFFSRPVLLGFLNGVAVIIIVSQLPKLFGISVHTDSTLGTLWQVITHLGDAQWRTIVLGAVLLAVLVLLGRFARLVPGALVVLVIGGALVSWLGPGVQGRGDHRGRSGRAAGTVGSAGQPRRHRHAGADRCWSGVRRLRGVDPDRARVRRAPRGAGRRQSRARRTRDRQPRSRSAAWLPVVLEPVPHRDRRDRQDAERNSHRSEPGSSVVVFLLWLTGVLHDVPTVALAAIVIYAAASLFEVGALRKLYHQDRTEFLVAVVTFAGVVVLGMEVGILLAVFLSLALLIARISRPRAAVIGAVEGAKGFHELADGQALEAASGVVVYRFDAPLFFANADYFVEHAIEAFDAGDPAPPRTRPRGRHLHRRHRSPSAEAPRGIRHSGWRRALPGADKTARARPAQRRGTARHDRRGPLLSEVRREVARL